MDHNTKICYLIFTKGDETLHDREKKKYKDASPKETINKIREILNGIGIIPIETHWKNSIKNYVSVRLTIQECSIGVNGKGTNHDYALASAYAELMERLQNMAHFRLSMDVSKEAQKYLGYMYAPDEKPMNFYQMIYSDEDWMKQQKRGITPGKDIFLLLKKWKKISYESLSCDFMTLPYMNLCTSRLSYIPIKMVSKMYMSNGMCAGNTLEEAVVQGISEILERYINIKILKEKITPPTFPKKYLKQYKGIYTMIKQIEERTGNEVIIKDCSFGEGFPVTAVIYIDKKINAYFVKFGSHPIFEISVERTLTELMQGQDISIMAGMVSFNYSNQSADSPENLMRIFVQGNGHFPISFFQDHSDYKWQPFRKIKDKTNLGLLKYLIEFIQEKGHCLYVRDVSFLGFPSFHVIIPGLSEIESIDDEKALNTYIQYNEIKRKLRNYKELPLEDKKIFLYTIENSTFFLTDITELLFIPVEESLPWYISNIGLFVVAAYYDIKDYFKAYQALSKWISFSRTKREYMSNPSYYQCMLNFLHMKSDGLKEEDIFKILKTFFLKEIIEKVYETFKKEKILEKNNCLICWNCSMCDVQDICAYPKTENLFKRLKEKNLENAIDQKKSFEGIMDQINKKG